MRKTIPTKVIDGITYRPCKNKKCGILPVSDFTVTYKKDVDGEIRNYYSSYCKKCVREAGVKYRQKRNKPVVFQEEYMKRISWNWPESLKRRVRSGTVGEFHGVIV